MATFDNQQGWLPVENSMDCTTQGFCTIYCPQWCYVPFPSPRPFSVTSNFNSSSLTVFSPLVLAIIGILATFFLVFSYYTLVTKICCFISFHRNHLHQRSNLDENLDEEDSTGENYHQVSWHLPPSNGLDEALIEKITVYRYKRGEGLVDGTECSVCLAEFRDDESLRLLPKCSHAFHLQCIDTWLKSHSNCPVCRANLFLSCLNFEEDGWNRAGTAGDNGQEAVVVVEVLDLDGLGDEGSGLLKSSLVLHGRAGICMEANDHRLVSGWSSRQGRGERRKERSYRSRGLHFVRSAVRMKRTVSSGRTWFARQGRGSVLLLPV